MKDYCEWCGCEVDEVEFTEFEGAHETCTKVKVKVKIPKLTIEKGNKTFYFVCKSARWNFYLNRFYPFAELIMISEIINPN